MPYDTIDLYLFYKWTLKFVSKTFSWLSKYGKKTRHMNQKIQTSIYIKITKVRNNICSFETKLLRLSCFDFYSLLLSSDFIEPNLPGY